MLVGTLNQLELVPHPQELCAGFSCQLSERRSVNSCSICVRPNQLPPKARGTWTNIPYSKLSSIIWRKKIWHKFWLWCLVNVLYSTYLTTWRHFQAWQVHSMSTLGLAKAAHAQQEQVCDVKGHLRYQDEKMWIWKLHDSSSFISDSSPIP